jgi:hypothetical protein
MKQKYYKPMVIRKDIWFIVLGFILLTLIHYIWMHPIKSSIHDQPLPHCSIIEKKMGRIKSIHNFSMKKGHISMEFLFEKTWNKAIRILRANNVDIRSYSLERIYPPTVDVMSMLKNKEIGSLYRGSIHVECR